MVHKTNAHARLQLEAVAEMPEKSRTTKQDAALQDARWQRRPITAEASMTQTGAVVPAASAVCKTRLAGSSGMHQGAIQVAAADLARRVPMHATLLQQVMQSTNTLQRCLMKLRRAQACCKAWQRAACTTAASERPQAAHAS